MSNETKIFIPLDYGMWLFHAHSPYTSYVLYVSYTEITLQVAGIPNSVFSDQANTLCQYTSGKIVVV